MKMMKKMLLLLVFWGCTVSSAWAFERTVQLSTAPAYQFQSTSAYPSMTGGSTFASTTVYAPCSSAPSSKPRRSEGNYNPWDDSGDDEGNPSGQGVGEVDTPIGEPLVLLLMAVAYLLFATLRKRQKEYHHLLNKNALKFAYMQKMLYLCSRV